MPSRPASVSLGGRQSLLRSTSSSVLSALLCHAHWQNISTCRQAKRMCRCIRYAPLIASMCRTGSGSGAGLEPCDAAEPAGAAEARSADMPAV